MSKLILDSSDISMLPPGEYEVVVESVLVQNGIVTVKVAMPKAATQIAPTRRFQPFSTCVVEERPNYYLTH